MAKKPTPRQEAGLAALHTLADLLKVDLEGGQLAIATPDEEATARMHDGSIEARVVPTIRGTVYVTAPRSPGIVVELVDHTRNSLAPKEAIYEIRSYSPDPDRPAGTGTSLNGDVANVYVGPEGIILSDAARRMAQKLPTQ